MKGFIIQQLLYATTATTKREKKRAIARKEKSKIKRLENIFHHRSQLDRMEKRSTAYVPFHLFDAVERETASSNNHWTAMRWPISHWWLFDCLFDRNLFFEIFDTFDWFIFPCCWWFFFFVGLFLSVCPVNNREIERVVYSGILEPSADWHSLTHEGSRDRDLRLTYRVRVQCNPNYYNATCTKFCRPRNDVFGHYDCDQNGDKTCMPGWTGTTCETGHLPHLSFWLSFCLAAYYLARFYFKGRDNNNNKNKNKNKWQKNNKINNRLE